MPTSIDLEAVLRKARIIPVVGVPSVETGMETVGRLAQAGAGVIEIVMRTPDAIEVIRRARIQYPDVAIAAGTVLDPRRYDEAVGAGAQFAVSPGLEQDLALHARGGRIPLVPGVQTASEVMTAMRHGFRTLKYYPAEPSNGSAVLSDFASIFPDVHFMPTGKIGPKSVPAYAALRNVLCVGGSWMWSEGGAVRSAEAMRALLEAGRAAFDGAR